MPLNRIPGLMPSCAHGACTCLVCYPHTGGLDRDQGFRPRIDDLLISRLCPENLPSRNVLFSPCPIYSIFVLIQHQSCPSSYCCKQREPSVGQIHARLKVPWPMRHHLAWRTTPSKFGSRVGECLLVGFSSVRRILPERVVDMFERWPIAQFDHCRIEVSDCPEVICRHQQEELQRSAARALLPPLPPSHRHSWALSTMSISSSRTGRQIWKPPANRE